MPKKSKRRFFGKSNKSKSAKQSRNASSSEPQQREQHESDSDENASAREEEHECEAIAGTSLVPNDSAKTMGQLESVTSATTVSETPKPEEQHRATITLKVIQFVGELPKETRDDDSETLRQEIFATSAEISGIETSDNGDDNKSVIEPGLLQGDESEAVGVVPELDHKKNEVSDEAERHQRDFDDNYRVESPKQICVESGSTKRHAMLIQEISESSSSEEVKQFLDSEATALEMKVDKVEGAISPRDYRVESPESSDESNNSKVLALRDDVTVQEISESSSSESVKNENLASKMPKKSPPPTQKLDTRPSLKIINIKELPTEDAKLPSSTVTSASSSRIIVTQFECKTEKKLNKAEEAILEALYGNKSLLQIPNLRLDVISEEGSDCGSDVDKQTSSRLINDELDDDDDVFLPVELSKKPPTPRRRIDRSRREVVEQPQLINTKIIETESNIPEGCKSWETTPVESELQAELVYLTSTSSSATDLSERDEITDTEEVEDTSEDTETNSLLENISVPSLDEIDAPIEMRMSQPSPVYSSDFYQEMNETKLADILEEDEDQAPRSLEILESQQQIEDVNKELHHLEESQGKRLSEEKEQPNDEDTQVKVEEEVGEVKAPETICDIAGDKKIIFDNDKARDDSFNRVTPTLFKRKNSSDSSSSSNNSQCTIIRQLDQKRVDALRDLCVQSLNQNGFDIASGDGEHKDMNEDGRITFQKKLNSASRNAPQIPIIDELELHYKRDDDLEGRENSKDRVITILQVPPEINRATGSVSPIEKERWVGVQSTRNPNVIVALSPMQKSYVMSSQDSSNTSADVLLDMHKKFVERRAYHESENSDDSRKLSEIQLEHVDQLEDGYFGDRESSVENIVSPKSAGLKDILSESKSSVAQCDNERKDVSTIASPHENKSTIKSADDDFKMNSIRNCLLRDEFFKSSFADVTREVDSASVINLPENFELKKFELENELKRLDSERRELEDELKNLQSLQHFKREEFLFNEKKRQSKLESEIENHSSVAKYANDDFNEFVYSNEKLQQELYNEWQDKVLERNERKMQKTIKITSITESIHHDAHSERATSEILKVVPLENEFMSKLKERQKRLSLPFEVNSSTESLHHQNEESMKVEAPQPIPAHLHEFLKYYEEEIALNKNSDESAQATAQMDNRNYVNSEYYAKLLREKIKRDSKVAKMQSKILHEQQKQQQQRAQFPKRPKKLAPEKISKHQPEENNEPEKCRSSPRMQKRFSSSDNGLLNEIDDSLNGMAKGFVFKKESTPTPTLRFRIGPKFRATIPPTGIWSECNRSEQSINGVKKSDSPPPPVWTPKSAPQSPTIERKFRPVPFESPTLARRNVPSNGTTPPPWTQPNYPDKPYQPSIIKSSSWNAISRPKTQITFRKARAADQINDRVERSLQNSQKEKSISFKTKPLTPVKSNEIVHTIRREFSSDTKDSKIDDTRKMTSTQAPPKKSEGVGPITREGMPVSMRSEVSDMNREQWYKKMYNTIHKAKDDDNYVTVKYKTRRGVPYKSNGYASEPDANYDSDYVVKYPSVDRKRTTSIGNQNEEKYGSYEQPVKQNVIQYKIQPGKIENYTPGKSSVSDKEAKQWWEDVMEIFDGWLEEHSSRPTCGVKLAREIQKFHLEQQKLSSNYTQGNLSRALKDQGYQSDSTLVFKKRSDVDQLSPVEQKQAYKNVQHGGEVPLHGFRKPLPERPKDDEEAADEVNDEVVAFKPGKIPYDERAIINSEIICYPITNISRPLDMFGAFPKSVKSFVPVVPPHPPNRKSSRTNSTLKIVKNYNSTPSRAKSCAKHDVRFSPVSKEDLNRSRSAGPSFINFASTKDEKSFDTRTRFAKRICYRANSSSPVSRKQIPERKSSQSPVAFGRGISKERAFAEEKKKIEEKLAKISKDLHVSTRILRNPELKSPNEVKRALHNTFKPISYSRDPKLASIVVKKSLESQAFRQSSGPKANSTTSKAEQKSLKVTVAISSRGREILRTSAEAPRSLRQSSNVSSLSSKSNALLRGTVVDSKNKLKAKSKGSVVTNSNNSLARTNSTFSIDSNPNAPKKKPQDAKGKNVPITIVSKNLKKSTSKASDKSTSTKKSGDAKVERKTLFQDPPLDDNRKDLESFNKAVVRQNEAIRSDAFFQKLFLRDNLRKHGLTLSPDTSVLQRARMWNALTACKSEPSLRYPNYYARYSRPVSRSKFRDYEIQNESETYAIFKQPVDESDALKGGFVTEQIYKYDSMYHLSDEDEFGNADRGRSLDFSYSYHERSNSEPPNKTLLTELVRPYSPVTIYGRNKSVEAEKRQRSSRSPSCRRIQSLKTNKLLELSSYQKELARAQSVGRTDRAKEKLSSTLQRSRSLNVLNNDAGLSIAGQRKNERFRDLSEFYTCLERIGQLECATSKSDLRPRRRHQEIIDYDLWQKVREYEKNERELNILVKKLRAEQRDKDFLFQPHAVDEVRWSAEADLGLVTKEKSVENLRDLFQSKAEEDAYKRALIDSLKDNYKPLWRASSVLDLASNMTQKYNKPKKQFSTLSLPRSEAKQLKSLGLSKKLLSTLSRDQLNQIKNQLSEIYSNEKASGSIEQFIVNVPPKQPSKSSTLEKPFLTVRSHSELAREQVQEPSIDISSLKNVFEGKEKASTPSSEISESQKRSISHTLCQEIKDKFSKKKKQPDIERVKKIDNVINAKTLPLPKKPKRDISFSFQEAPPAATKYLDCIPVKKPQAETESISSETSNRTVIFREPGQTIEDVQAKIKYFEEIEREKEKVPVTIYHACDDSSPDDEDTSVKRKEEMPVAEKYCEAPSDKASSAPKSPKLSSSQSFTDLKDLYGERSSMKSSTYRGSTEHFAILKRSRSSSPAESEKYYKSLIEYGDVEKLKMKFENYCSADDDDGGCHYIYSDSEVNRASVKKTRVRGHEFGNVSHITHKYEMQSKRARSRTRRASPILKHSLRRDDRLMPHINVISKTASLKDHQRISVSNKDNLDKVEPLPSTSGEVVAKIKHKFEALEHNLSLMGKMYTSVPDFRELKEISPHLSHLPYCGSFASHQFPRPEDNSRSVCSPDKSPSGIQPRKRPSSASPIRTKEAAASSSSSNLTKQLRDIFDDQKFDYALHSRRYRYPVEKQLQEDFSLRRKTSAVSFKVEFLENGDSVYPPPPPPPPLPNKNIYPLSRDLSGYHSDSQKRYVENEMNIHYKVPVRYECKPHIPDDELAYQQAEHMKKVYQEERRRKYLQELQDMSNRRHTDNFTPSQKSPIALNRYDDFGFDLPSSKSPVNLPGTVAKALYSFQGQSARELSFKKGDIIYIRRQIDKNWYEGEHNATYGLLPVQYVDIISNDGTRPVTARKPTEGQARAKFNFVAQSDIELSLSKGELVTLTRLVDNNWFEGRIGNRKGIFPVSYVDVLADIGSDDLENTISSTSSHTVKNVSPSLLTPNSDIVRETKTTRKTEVLHVDTASEPIQYRAVFNYRPVNSDELELREGDIIYVLEQCDDGWFVGTNSRNGFFGTFPGNYVRRVY